MMRTVRAGVVFLSIAFVAGCGGPDLGEAQQVSGKITLDGKPLADATVTFFALSGIPAEHRSKSGTTDAQGSYTVADVYPAEYQVLVMVTSPGAEAAGEIDPGSLPAEGPADPLAAYSTNSPLGAKVEPGKTSFDFELKSGPPKK